jgi:hypothetical protein
VKIHPFVVIHHIVPGAPRLGGATLPGFFSVVPATIRAPVSIPLRHFLSFPGLSPLSVPTKGSPLPGWGRRRQRLGPPRRGDLQRDRPRRGDRDTW